MRKSWSNIYKIALLSLMVVSCEDDFEEINTNPNEPEVVLSNTIFNSATKELMDETRDEFTAARMSIPWMQYWAQTSYADEDRYLYRETSAESFYEFSFRVASDLKKIIDFNTDPETSGLMSSVGNNDNQIAACRIILSYIFHQLVDTYGDIPYYSFGSNNPDFQGLDIDNEVFLPKFAEQEDIYLDILSELNAASDQINTSEPVFTSGDNIYGGDAVKWKKFANSLILRVANRYKGVNPTVATAAINEAVANGVFESNDDNAIQAYEQADATASPLYSAFFVDNRTDFAVAAPFINLLKGDVGFGLDPRLFEFAAPIEATIASVQADNYVNAAGETLAEDNPDDYTGIPYTFPSVNLIPFTTYSFASSNVLRQDFGEVFMEYSEVAFILSENNAWSQSDYENGVRASMERWGVDALDIDAFVTSMPAASEETVLTQKYIALYMQGGESWAEYRRTGFPKTLLLPNQTGVLDADQVASSVQITSPDYVFIPLEDVDDLPSRIRYPVVLQTLNGANRQEAANKLTNGDNIDSKLFWDVN